MIQREPIVYIVDDDHAVRDSLEFLLQAHGYKVRGFGSASAIFEIAPHMRSGCLITDVRMPEISGLDLLQHMRKTSPNIPVIVITGHGDIALAVTAMRNGAADFLEKPIDEGLLLSALRSALECKVDDDKHFTELATIRDRLSMLSSREKQILEGLLSGNLNKMIAFDLGISPRTVEKYRVNLMTKMAANSLSHLVHMALLGGFLAGSGDSDH
jgi:two-component system, LuxR family, response regulator FixJ